MGDKFSPKFVEEHTGISFTKKMEIGDIEVTGINKGMPSKYGYATLYPPNEVIDPEYYYSGFDWIISKLGNVVEMSRKYGADDIYLDIAVYHNNSDCLLSFKPESLTEIAKANISFWISCYGDYDDEDDDEDDED